MEKSNWLQDDQFLKVELSQAIRICEEYFQEALPPNSVSGVVQSDRSKAIRLVGFALLRFAILRLNLPVSVRSAQTKRDATTLLRKIALKGSNFSIPAHAIIQDVCDGEGFADIAIAQLTSLFEHIGISEKNQIALLLYPTIEWLEAQVYALSTDLMKRGTMTVTPSNSEIHFSYTEMIDAPKKRPSRRIGKVKK